MTQQARKDSLSHMLRRSALRHRDRQAIICGDVTWSYADFDAVVDQLARGLASRNIVPGDRVAVLARNSHAFMALRFAVARIGAVFVPINFMLIAEEVRFILENSGARLLFVDCTTAETGLAAAPDTVERVFGLTQEDGGEPDQSGVTSWSALLVDGAPVEDVADRQDLLQIIYTSGTESRPKGAMLTHDAVLLEYQSCIIDGEWTRDTVTVHALPLFHCAQLDAMIGPALQIGAINVITASPAPENVIPLLDRFAATAFFAPPTVWISLLRSPLFDEHDLSRLERGFYGASIMPREVIAEMQRRLPGLRLWNFYGQTEIAPVATVLFPEEHATRIGSAGRATINVETRVVDDDMNDVAPGEVGEVVHRSPQLLVGYWNDPERTAEAFAGGWFLSGDLATMDAEGYLTIVDRKKDMIKSGGENVASREVEEVLYAHPAVSEVAVIGLPHPIWIEAVTAFVVFRAGLSCDESDIRAFCSARLAGFKTPKTVHIVDTLPRNASGKILKRNLRESALADGAADSPGG